MVDKYGPESVVETVKQKRRHDDDDYFRVTRSGIFAQMLTALLSAVLVGFVGWLAGFNEMRYNLNQLNVQVTKLEKQIDLLHDDINQMRLRRAENDGDLKARLRVVEEHHQKFRMDTK